MPDFQLPDFSIPQLLNPLELQPGFAGGIGQGLDPSVINVAAPVEHDFLDALGFGALGDVLADSLGRGQIASGALFALLAFGGVRGNQGRAFVVVDQLDVNV